MKNNNRTQHTGKPMQNFYLAMASYYDNNDSYGGISINRYILSTIFIIIASAFFSGCIDKEQTQAAVTPVPTKVITPTQTPEVTPTITIATPTPTPTPIPTPTRLVKSGYKLYQNDQYNYSFIYPSTWDYLGTAPTTDPNGMGMGIERPDDVNGAPTGGVNVIVYNSDPKIWDQYGGMTYLRAQGIVISNASIIVNGRKTNQVVAELVQGTRGTWITVQANNRYYVMIVHSPIIYYIGKDTTNDLINSWIIGNI